MSRTSPRRDGARFDRGSAIAMEARAREALPEYCQLPHTDRRNTCLTCRSIPVTLMMHLRTGRDAYGAIGQYFGTLAEVKAAIDALAREANRGR